MRLRMACGTLDAANKSAIESSPPLTASSAMEQVFSACATAFSSCAETSIRWATMIALIYLSTRDFRLETHGPLGTLWVSFGLIAFYIALIWLNSLLGFFLTPLLTGIPISWLLDWRKRRKGQLEDRSEAE